MMMSINEETRARIITAANDLFEQAGRADFPTVDAVRRASKTGMGDASLVMKDWRRMQAATAAPVAVAVPDRLRQVHAAALASLWTEAQEIANEALNAAQTAWDVERAQAEALRGEMSDAFEAQAREIAAAQLKIVELEANAKIAAAELVRERDSARNEANHAREEAAELRGQLNATQKQQDALLHAVATRSAKAEPKTPAPAKTTRAKKADTL